LCPLARSCELAKAAWGEKGGILKRRKKRMREALEFTCIIDRIEKCWAKRKFLRKEEKENSQKGACLPPLLL